MSPKTFKALLNEYESGLDLEKKFAGEVDLFNIDSLIETDIEEIVGNVTGDGYRWVWLLTTTSVAKAHRKAVTKVRLAAARKGCNAIIGLTTNVTYFPGFLGFRGCSVLLTGTAVKI